MTRLHKVRSYPQAFNGLASGEQPTVIQLTPFSTLVLGSGGPPRDGSGEIPYIGGDPPWMALQRNQIALATACSAEGRS
jgi:hypothetical protein